MDLVSLLQRIVIFMPAFLFALVIHEYAHAWMAHRFGDKTSEWSGRLTLNPMAHIDPLGTIVFPLISILSGLNIFFGWAKPVPINPSLFTNYRKGLFWVAFAGPLSNILGGTLCAFLLVGLQRFLPPGFEYAEAIQSLLEATMILNFSLAIFNLLPIPPLDGSNIVLSFLDYEATRKFLAIQQYSFFILIFLMVSGALSVIRYPIIFLVNLSMILASAVFSFT